MKYRSSKYFLKEKWLLALCFIFLMTGCQIIGGIFKAGVWVGALLVLVIVGVVLYLVLRGSGKN